MLQLKKSHMLIYSQKYILHTYLSTYILNSNFIALVVSSLEMSWHVSYKLDFSSVTLLER